MFSWREKRYARTVEALLGALITLLLIFGILALLNPLSVIEEAVKSLIIGAVALATYYSIKFFAGISVEESGRVRIKGVFAPSRVVILVDIIPILAGIIASLIAGQLISSALISHIARIIKAAGFPITITAFVLLLIVAILEWASK